VSISRTLGVLLVMAIGLLAVAASAGAPIMWP
jgi:hypothetical protein